MEAAARPFSLVAALVLVFMMLFTTVGVIMRQFFGTPILGVVDVMELALVTCVFVAMPGTFFRDENLTVDVIDPIVPRAVRVVLRLIGLVLTLGFLLLITIEMIEPALDKLYSGEVTMTLAISRFIHWLPIIFGFAASAVATVCILVHYLRNGVPMDPVLDRPHE